jgi:hypothetical protein
MFLNTYGGAGCAVPSCAALPHLEPDQMGSVCPAGAGGGSGSSLHSPGQPQTLGNAQPQAQVGLPYHFYLLLPAIQHRGKKGGGGLISPVRPSRRNLLP